ncbi:type II toxin-antitoxin system RelB/DinJ family antitoxin [Arenibaculum sp.]|jgi:DNA-damage-inducible protein J|uniref:type II toxin-antitoxin system RelB/DinJ family antitoxin n=1 Tax=Arenibaculum sp. TaxID=2865862 RepID=UPI002E0D9D7C|nr:type II toxin-antitoxin system RelB/DinJ family antitoxin [Arenibaculum sp.]
MAATDVVRARIDPDVKKAATAVLAEMGLSVSDAIRLMLVRIAADRSLPFEIRVPNDRTEAALRAAQQGKVNQFENVAALIADLNDDED